MKTLIICVDRDDDIGVKAGVETPVIGREESLDAAMKLALKDAEDTDVNTIFGAVKVYDGIQAVGEEAEITIISGDRDIGVISDRKIAKKLDSVLETVNADHTIVVTDGAEDECILPIIQSRVKVDSVKRVVVRQTPNLESTYYQIKQAFNDPKIAGTFFIPLGIIFLLYAIGLFAGHPEGAMIPIMGAVGIYLLFRGLGLDDVLETFTETMKDSFYGGKITFITYIVAGVLVVVATVIGLIESWGHHISEPFFSGYLELTMAYINGSVWWYTSAGLLSGLGKIIDTYIENKHLWRRWHLLFIITSLGLAMWGGSKCILLFVADQATEALQILFFSLLGAVFLSLVGVGLSRYMRVLVHVEPE